MTDLSDIEYARIVSAFSQEGNAEERAWLRHWAAASPERRAILAHLDRTWSVLRAVGEQERVLRMEHLRSVVEAHVQATTRAQEVARVQCEQRADLYALPNAPPSEFRTPTNSTYISPRGNHAQHRTFLRRPWHRVTRVVAYPAAACLLAVTLLIIGWQGGIHRSHTPVMVSQSDYITAKGERAKVTLPDGSHVLLNVASRLEVPPDFAAGNRTVRLTGEAFFDISSHTGSPFTVMTGTTATRVLGTSFVVRNYPTDTATTVAVRTGKVSVQSVVVAAAQEAQVGLENIVHLHPADSAQFGFINGVLVFNSVPLSTAIIELDRWYNADIRLADPAMAALRMTGECSIGSLTDLSNLLALTFDARVVRDGKVLTLYPK